MGTLVNLHQDGKGKSPICVLQQGTQENQKLELILPGGKKHVFSLSGKKVSQVHLTGYIQPLIDAEDVELEDAFNEMKTEREVEEKESSNKKRALEEEDDSSAKKQ